MSAIVQQWIIQDRETGMFLTEELTFASSFAAAGRCYSADEALVTAVDNCDPGGFEIFSFFDYSRIT